MRWFVAVALSGLVAFSNFAAAQSGSTSVEALQAEIARLKEQLSKLEAQLAELQKQQKATEKVTQRFEPITLRGYIQMRYERDSSRPTDVTSELGAWSGERKLPFAPRSLGCSWDTFEGRALSAAS
jgi:uncharacterized protein YdeI (BOF family)